MAAYADLECERCKRPKIHYGVCDHCPYDPTPGYRDIEKQLHFKVTPELHQFAQTIFELDEELEIFGKTERKLSRLEKQAIKILRRERSKFEKSQFEK